MIIEIPMKLKVKGEPVQGPYWVPYRNPNRGYGDPTYWEQVDPYSEDVVYGPIDQYEAMREAWEDYQASRGELAGTCEFADCYQCGWERRKAGRDQDTQVDDWDCPYVSQRIIALGPVVEARRDPTQSYRLRCGHTTI